MKAELHEKFHDLYEEIRENGIGHQIAARKLYMRGAFDILQEIQRLKNDLDAELIEDFLLIGVPDPDYRDFVGVSKGNLVEDIRCTLEALFCARQVNWKVQNIDMDRDRYRIDGHVDRTLTIYLKDLSS